MRKTVLIAVTIGAIGSVGFLIRAAERTPPLLLVCLVLWALAPFVVLTWANVVSNRWSPLTRAALHGVTLVLTFITPVLYSELVVVAPVGSPRGFVFVLVPPVSGLLAAAVVLIAALISRRRSRLT